MLLAVFDIMGREVLRTAIAPSVSQVSVSRVLGAGNYIVRLTAGNTGTVTTTTVAIGR
jgi:hypothetical protein